MEYFDVKRDTRHLSEMLKITHGKRQVPVIVKGEEITIGFGGT